MTKLKTFLRDYLSQTGILGEIPLGESITFEQNNRHLKLQLQDLRKKNKMTSIYLTILLIIPYIIGLLIVFIHIDNKAIIAIFFGGSTFPLVIIVNHIKNVWHQNIFIDMIIEVLDQTQPSEAVNWIHKFWTTLIK